MGKGEFDSPSKPASEAYRENWERMFGLKPGETYFINREAWQKKFGSYPNGCPILPEGPQKDDL